MPKAKSSSGDWSRTHPYLRGIPENERSTATIKRTRKKGIDRNVMVSVNDMVIWHCKDGKVLINVATA
jgi:hypothetical protein